MSDLRERVMVVFVDALGPQQLETLGSGLRSFPHRRALDGVLGYSSGALASVLTGVPPSAHGRMCLFSAREQGAGILAPLRWLGLLPRVIHERGAVRRTAARALARAAHLTGYVALHRVPPSAFPWLDLPEREDLFTADRVGGARTFLADARDAGVRVYAAPWQLPEPRRWDHAHAALSLDPPELAFLYAAELDAALHQHGNASAAAAGALDRISTHIERAREEMSRGGARLTVLVVGDHGMADVHSAIDPRDVVAKLERDHMRVFVDSTMLRLWGTEPSLERARATLEAARFPGKWLDATALAARDAPVRGAPYGDAFFLLDEGALFSPSYVGGRVHGMHGYDLETGSSRAALASDAPISPECTSITSVARVVRDRLGLSP